jgi:hypothetical protein
MELKDFVAQSLHQIVQGVKEAQATDTGAVINPRIDDSSGSNPDALKKAGRLFEVSSRLPIEEVDFDVAVTVEESGQAGGKIGAGIKVLGLEAGMSGASETRNSSVSRIRFSVLVKLPLGK